MRPTSRTHRPRILPVALALVVAAIGSACGPVASTPSRTVAAGPSPSAGLSAVSTRRSPPTPASASPSSSAPAAARDDGLRGLLLLSGRTGAMGLEVVDTMGIRRSIASPDPGVAWISTSLDGRALATTLDGRAFASEALGAETRPGWRPIDLGFDPRTLAGPLAFGVLAPDGSRAAFLAADYGRGGPFDLVILPVAPASGRPVAIRIDRAAEGAPPCWFGDRVVFLARTPGDTVGALLVDPSQPGRITEVGGSAADPPGPVAGRSIAALSIAADGRTVAVAPRGDGRIVVGPAEPWLTGRATATTATPAPVELVPDPGGSRAFDWLALAPDGERIAIVRTDADGSTVGVSVHDRADGWRLGRTIPLAAGADRAVVGWLP